MQLAAVMMTAVGAQMQRCVSCTAVIGMVLGLGGCQGVVH
jgi:hypothetical protein